MSVVNLKIDDRLAKNVSARAKVLIVFFTACMPLLSVGADLDDIDALTERWVTIEQQRTAIRSNWLERERIGSTQIKLLRAERQSLRTFLDDAAQSDTEIDQRRIALFSEQQQLEARDAALQLDMRIIVDELVAIQKQIPPPLQSKWEGHLAKLGQEKLSLSEKLSTVLVLLDETADFSKRIALHKSRMTFGDRTILVNELYLGLSHGWYISDDASAWGSGRAHETGWRWQEASTDPEFDNSQLYETIKLVESGSARGLVSLPVFLGNR